MLNFLKKRHANKLVNLIGTVLLIIIVVILMANGKRASKTLIITISIAIIMAVSLNISAGSLGEIVLGHAGFMAIGAYSAAIFLIYTKIPSQFLAYVLALIIGGTTSGLAGLIVGIPTLRVRGDYLAIVTLGFGEIVRMIICNTPFLGSSIGLNNIPDILSTSNGASAILIALSTTSICVATIYCFMTTRHGRAILAIREDEIAAEASGIPVIKYKVLAFTLSAIFAGVGGAMFAQTLSFISPNNFSLDQSVNYLVMVVFGGLGSYTGSVLSAIFLSWLNYKLVDLNTLRMVIYSVILILIMIFKPTGLFGIKEFSLRGFIVNFKSFLIKFKCWLKSLPRRIIESIKSIKSAIIKAIKHQKPIIKSYTREKCSKGGEANE